MNSNKRKRAFLTARRAKKRLAPALWKQVEAAAARARALAAALERGAVAVDLASLDPSNSYGMPDFVLRGTYLAQPFDCKGCRTAEVWTPEQQKWWYEVAKGDVSTKAVMCRTCRRNERNRRDAARKASLEGRERKLAKLSQTLARRMLCAYAIPMFPILRRSAV